MANALLELGVAVGSRLAVLGDNCGDTMLTYVGAALAGVGVIMVNVHLTVDEIEYQLRDGGACAIWASSAHVGAAVEAASRCGIPVLAEVGDPVGGRRWCRRRARSAPPDDTPTTTDLIYTSGTTGTPKGVETPNQPAANVADRIEVLGRHHLVGLGNHLVVGPLYHAGPHASVGLLLNGEQVIVAGHFDAGTVLDAIERYRVASSITVPTHLLRLLALPETRRAAADVSSVRRISVTGSACPVPLKRAMIEWWGPVFREAYGGSESGIISAIESEDWLAHPGSVGRVEAPFHALVIDEHGAPCPTGRDGVLYFVDDTGRGIRYYHDDEKTAAAHLEPGTFTLGDVGHVDDDGYLYITGRITDMVISGGVNIYPAECERVLLRHPAVADVVLFGVPDDEMGERLVGMVSIRDDATTVDDLIAFCRSSIAHYKVPRHLQAVDEIPRTPMGKVDKRTLRAAYVDGQR